MNVILRYIYHYLTTIKSMHTFTAIPRYNAVRLALIRYYAAIAFQPCLDILVARFRSAVTRFVYIAS
jgi:hypothetical protein